MNFIARVYGVQNRDERIAESLQKLGLTDKKDQLMGELSGGWKQRVALAICLIHDPDLLLLDEPTSGVDPMARREFWDQIHALSEQGVTTLVSTHYMDEAERCTRIAYLAFGKILTTGTVDEVIQHTQLKSWEISGDVTTSLLQKVKKLKGVKQSALYGNLIRVSAYKKELIEKELEQLASQYNIQWAPKKPSLEEAFISLVDESPEPIVD